MAVQTVATPKTLTDALVVELYRVKQKAEIVNGRIVLLPLNGEDPSRTGASIAVSLRQYAKTTDTGRAYSGGVGYLVNLKTRGSFCPDASFFQGPRSGMKFLSGAPVFAVEVRSEGEYGRTAEREIAEKRAEYFDAGTLIVWDVDLLSDDVIKVYAADDPESPRIFRRGEIADAEPVLPDWRMPVDELFD